MDRLLHVCVCVCVGGPRLAQNPFFSAHQHAAGLPLGARRYIDYILETVSRREVLQYLCFQPTVFWHTLLYKDRCAGLPVERLAGWDEGVFRSHVDGWKPAMQSTR